MAYLYAISGFKNSGKTTLITMLVKILSDKGYKVAVIKHDGHEFEGDVPGTDTHQHFMAGAYGTAIFSAGKFLIHKKQHNITEQQLVKAFPEADIILLEGFKDSNYPKYWCNYPKEELINPEILAEQIIAGMKIASIE